jgi:hypothetical protein
MIYEEITFLVNWGLPQRVDDQTADKYLHEPF